jgi:outer membrane protein assembly factor BamE (lipoprotein component of BamABCDE complex)
MRSFRLVALLACLSLAACEVQRARLAANAQVSMVGRTKEQVLACMGPPAGKATEGAAEIWSYLSGDRSMETMQSSGGGFISGAKSQPSCTINFTMVGGLVSKVSYASPTGEPIAANQQCAFALEDCIPH